MLSFGALIVSLLLFRLYAVVQNGISATPTLWTIFQWFLYPLLYLTGRTGHG